MTDLCPLKFDIVKVPVSEKAGNYFTRVQTLITE